ncbi:hypothetical protein P4909_02435 [Escherichia coli]
MRNMEGNKDSRINKKCRRSGWKS